jgi:hypothetical protein
VTDDKPIPTGTPTAIAGATDLHDLLRHRVASAIEQLKPGTRRAYRIGLAQFSHWLRLWLPTAPDTIRAAVGGAVEWHDVILRLDRVTDRSAPLIASTIVEAFLIAIADRGVARCHGSPPPRGGRAARTPLRPHLHAVPVVDLGEGETGA